MSKQYAQYKTYSEIKDRLDQIAQDVKAKGVSLEQSLDLFEEAIALGSKIVDLVDKTDFTEEEVKQIEQVQPDTQES